MRDKIAVKGGVVVKKIFKLLGKPEKTYYIHAIQDTDKLNQLVETPASKTLTDEWWKTVNFSVSTIALIFAIAAFVKSFFF